MKPRCAPSPMRLRRGFTLVEIMVVVVILGLLIAIAVPTYRRFQRKSQNTTFVNNLRLFTQAFETYAMKYGTWPLTSDPTDPTKIIPVDAAGHSMSGEFRDSDWKAGALGGQWKWNFVGGGGHPKAYISIVGVNVDVSQMDEIAVIVNTGTTGTPSFQKTADPPLTYSYTVQY